ncbi:hypothetical protein A2872_01025 [Candidatus Gottesmanbacteria bacterium RIFCSPHIGHO2_01_FULL_42_12]|uniref:Uncharacterized protein n=1 Tax=Candidatus Gottesmanbacteria bacterium RIFCSPHIGHO2_01_FULL_42_12 TaxID=1798377 RepID=A0A1F5Z353_9BACT|nr:MAG: hypothetical protein A2872_01025 [Candidatus Gottesmanbacteria bacterium RIFCSPHIGHO2_01_FULL_42_12]
MEIEKIYIGGWFQRTTLHLTEVYDFLHNGRSDLGFPLDDLLKMRDSLNLESVERVNWLLEYISVKNKKLNWRMYEDGLIVLERDYSGSIKDDFYDLEDYYDRTLSPAISYIFSKGAPVPKELANIKTLLPFIVVVKKAQKEEVENFFAQFGENVYSRVQEEGLTIYKSPKIILLIATKKDMELRNLIESQIFFREFKTQLHKYLNIHRLIWDEIAQIKERGVIKGREAKTFKAKLDQYQKTVELITSRIDQMDTYLKTRAKISASGKSANLLEKAFLYKFETLENTLNYVKDLWKMTEKYLISANKIFTDIQTESTKTAISSLQLITTLGVMAAIISYLGRDKLPAVTLEGVVFLSVLVFITWLANYLVNKVFSERDYQIRQKREGFDV